MLIWIGKILASKFGPYIVGAIGLALLVLTFYGWLWLHDKNIEQAATLKFNQQQLQIIIEEQKKYNSKLDEISKLQQDAIESLKKQREAVDQVGEDIRQKVERKGFKDLGTTIAPSTRETLQQLRDRL